MHCANGHRMRHLQQRRSRLETVVQGMLGATAEMYTRHRCQVIAVVQQLAHPHLLGIPQGSSVAALWELRVRTTQSCLQYDS